MLEISGPFVVFPYLPGEQFVEQSNDLLRGALIRQRGESADVREEDAAKQFSSLYSSRAWLVIKWAC